MNQPRDPQPNTPPGRSPEISASRRGFFREMLILGLEGAERAGRRMGRRFGDAFERAHPIAPPPRPPLDLDRDENAEPRDKV